MSNGREFNSMALQAFMDPSEWCIFKERVQEISSSIPNILGVLAVGSLIQTFRPPYDFYENRRIGPMGIAYEAIRNPGRRKIFPGKKSDLDLWICTKDTPQSSSGESIVDINGIALLEELASGAVVRPSQQWCRKKEGAFSDYYKKSELYAPVFSSLDENNEPWMASRFKNILEQDVLAKLPDFVERIGRFTLQKIPGDFLEVRAFPESLFHLRPDESTLIDGFEDRQPFPRIADDQWISPQHKSVVLYNTGDSTIYPFAPKGRILGQAIDDYLLQEVEVPRSDSTYGAVLIKPDAIETGQVEIIKQKILKGLAPYCGRIVLEKDINGLNPLQVEQIYPLLAEQDMQDATKYLANGESLVIVIKANLPPMEMLAKLGEIKGLRLADRDDDRLFEGRITGGSIRDLLPLPADENKYRALMPSLFRRKTDPTHKFTPDEYTYYSRNLIHSPDNMIELRGLLDIVGVSL